MVVDVLVSMVILAGSSTVQVYFVLIGGPIIVVALTVIVDLMKSESDSESVSLRCSSLAVVGSPVNFIGE